MNRPDDRWWGCLGKKGLPPFFVREIGIRLEDIWKRCKIKTKVLARKEKFSLPAWEYQKKLPCMSLPNNLKLILHKTKPADRVRF